MTKRTRCYIGPKPYKSYLFRDKDPVIDQLRTIKADGRFKDTAIERAGGPSSGTLHNWWKGSTRRPQSASVEAAGRAMGKMRVWVDLDPRLKGKGGVK